MLHDMSERPTHKDRETTWSAYLAEKLDGVPEVRTIDNTRCDIVTDDMAIEVEWANKWPEAIGQVLRYSVMLGRKPAIIFLLKTPADRLHVTRAAVAIGCTDIVMLDSVKTYERNDSWDPE